MANHRRVQPRQHSRRNRHRARRTALHYDEGGHRTQQSNKRFGSTATSRSATYNRTSSRRHQMMVSCPSNVAGHQMTNNRTGNAAGHQMTSSCPSIAAGHQVTSNHTSYAAGFQRFSGGQPYGATTKTAQARDTDGRGGNKEFTPRGQNQGRDFCQDCAQPGQVVRDDIPGDATKRLPQPGPAATAGASSARGQFLPARSKITCYGNIGRRARISALSVGNANRTVLWLREIWGYYAPKIHLSRDT